MKTLILTAILCLAYSTSYAQTNTPSAPPKEGPVEQVPTDDLSVEEATTFINLLTAEAEAQLRRKGASNKLSTIYAEIARNPKLSRRLIGSALSDYLELKLDARGAAQVSQAVDEASIRILSLQAAQNALLIEQNKRMIELLEQLAKKK